MAGSSLAAGRLADNPQHTPRRGGRPSREEAEQLGEKILTVATQLFLENGYGATSIEAVAERARISKRTFYHRFADKSALFGAVVHRIIEGLRPPPDIPLFVGETIDEILRRLASLMLRAAMTPAALALNRLVVAEATRFPDLAATLAKEGATAEVIADIAALLDREQAAGRIKFGDTGFAAAQYMQLVIAIPQKRAMGIGAPMSQAELDVWATDSVALFLNGCRG
jgi:AcrR family transcriptional regulator